MVLDAHMRYYLFESYRILPGSSLSSLKLSTLINLHTAKSQSRVRISHANLVTGRRGAVDVDLLLLAVLQ